MAQNRTELHLQQNGAAPSIELPGGLVSLMPDSPCNPGAEAEPVSIRNSRLLSWAQLGCTLLSGLLLVITMNLPWSEDYDNLNHYVCSFTHATKNGEKYSRGDGAGLNDLVVFVLMLFQWLVLLHHTIWAIVRLRRAPSKFANVGYGYLVLMVLSYAVLIPTFYLVRECVHDDCTHGSTRRYLANLAFSFVYAIGRV